jgi:hypothetical protein
MFAEAEVQSFLAEAKNQQPSQLARGVLNDTNLSLSKTRHALQLHSKTPPGACFLFASGLPSTCYYGLKAVEVLFNQPRPGTRFSNNNIHHTR